MYLRTEPDLRAPPFLPTLRSQLNSGPAHQPPSQSEQHQVSVRAAHLMLQYLRECSHVCVRPNKAGVPQQCTIYHVSPHLQLACALPCVCAGAKRSLGTLCYHGTEWCGAQGLRVTSCSGRHSDSSSSSSRCVHQGAKAFPRLSDTVYSCGSGGR